MILTYQFILLGALLLSLRLRPQSPKRFNLFLAAFVLLEAASKFIKEVMGANNLPFQNIAALGSVASFLYVFLHAARPEWIRPALGLYAITIGISLFTQSPFDMMSAAYIPGMLMTMGAICYYLYHLVVKSEYTPLARIPQFWMAVGILLFFSCAFPMLVFGNALTAADRPLASQLWPLVSYGNVFLALGFLAVSLCQLNTRTSSSPSP